MFVPERWLGSEDGWFPAAAWRAFERGPRNCIGQALALIEARVVLTLVAGRYEFEKVGLGATKLEGSGKGEIAEELYMVSLFCTWSLP